VTLLPSPIGLFQGQGSVGSPAHVHNLYRRPVRSMRYTCNLHASRKPPPCESMRFSRIMVALHHAASDLAKSSRLSIPQPPSSAVRCRAHRPPREHHTVTRTPLGHPAWYAGAASPDGVCPCVTRQLYRLGKRSHVLRSPHFPLLLYYRSMPRRFFPDAPFGVRPWS
jgi:hypothetical protein